MGSKGRGRRLAGLAAALGATLAAPPALAAELNLDIPQQPRDAALIALARAANLSLGFAPGARCGGRAGVSGRMPLDTALERLLAGSNCVALRPDARTIVIRPRPPAAPLATAPSPPRSDGRAAPTQLGELVVTADKTESLLSASPYGLTAMGGAELERRGVSDVADLSLIAAGVTVTNLGPGRDKVLLRGLSDGPLTGHTQSTVGLYLGDLRLTYNAPDPDLPLIDLARVEVLRGPQGSLYGAGSIGGILQIVPNAPDPAARSGRIGASIATTDHGALSRSVEGVLNQPLPGGTAALRVAAWSEVAGGYTDNPGLGRSNVDRSTRRGFRLAAQWRPAEDLTLEATLIDQAIGTRDAHYATPEVGALARATASAEPHDNDFLALALAAHWTPDWGHLTLSVGALDHDVGTTYDAAGAPAALGGGAGALFKDNNEIRGLVSEARLGSVGSGRWHWTLGAFNALGDQRLDAAMAPAAGAAGYSERRRDRLLESAVFGQLSYDLTDDLTLTLGGRAFRSRLKTRSEVEAAGGRRAFEGRTRDSGVAPRLLLAYRPAPGLTLYAQAAEGYRTPGFNTSGPLGQAFGDAGGAQPLRRYSGDELWSYEAGARWRPDDLGLTVRAAVFQANWTDIQADLILASGLPFTANLGDGRSRGVELEATWRHGPLTLAGNLVRQDPELRRPAPGLPIRADIGLPGVSDFNYAATATWTADLASDRTLDLTASYAHVGGSRLTFDAGTAPAMGDYGDLRLAATLHARSWSLRLSVDNALDRRGDTLAFGNPFTFRTQTQATPQRPRTVGLGLTRSF